MVKKTQKQRTEANTEDSTKVERHETVHDRMRDDILSLALHPGMLLDEWMLSTRYGVSRTPIREALIRLSAEGLVVMARKRNAQVAPLIMSDLPRYLEALELLQRSACHLAALRRRDPDIDKMRNAASRFEEAAKGTDITEMAVANTAFHVAVSEGGHNAYLTEAYSQTLVRGQRMLRLPLLYSPRGGSDVEDYLTAELREHEETIKAISKGNAEDAEALGRNHCERFRAAINQYLNENLTSAIDVNASAV